MPSDDRIRSLLGRNQRPVIISDRSRGSDSDFAMEEYQGDRDVPTGGGMSTPFAYEPNERTAFETPMPYESEDNVFDEIADHAPDHDVSFKEAASHPDLGTDLFDEISQHKRGLTATEQANQLDDPPTHLFADLPDPPQQIAPEDSIFEMANSPTEPDVQTASSIFDMVPSASDTEVDPDLQDAVSDYKSQQQPTAPPGPDRSLIYRGMQRPPTAPSRFGRGNLRF